MAGVRDPEPCGDRLELLAPRVGRGQMRAHVPEQAGHLAQHVLGRREVQQVGLRRVDVAPRPLDERPVSEHPQASPRVELLRRGGLPGCAQVVFDRRGQDLVPLADAPSRGPRAQRLELLGPRQGPFPPGARNGTSHRRRWTATGSSSGTGSGSTPCPGRRRPKREGTRPSSPDRGVDDVMWASGPPPAACGAAATEQRLILGPGRDPAVTVPSRGETGAIRTGRMDGVSAPIPPRTTRRGRRDGTVDG